MTREEVLQLIKEELTVSVEASEECYGCDGFGTIVRVRLYLGGEEISYDSDSISS